MASNYVKFMRGTPAEYLLTQKNPDTLYFVSEPDSNRGQLYLGEKLISGSGSEGGGNLSSIKLDDLTDVIVNDSELKDKSFLVYNASLDSWVNTDLEDLIFIGATSLSNGGAGIIPAPTAGQENYFLRGDGTWAPAPSGGGESVSKAVFYEIVLEENKTHEDAIDEAVGTNILNNGDIAIIKELVAEDKYQYTAYVYDSGKLKWVAMDGNYNADNVYFDKDIIVTTQIGTIKELTNGKATLSAKGKNLAEVFSNLVAKREAPAAANPYATIELSNTMKNQMVEIGTEVIPGWKTTFSSGSFSYGPNTGCISSESTVSLMDSNNFVTISANDLNNKTGILNTYTVADTIPRKLQLTYGYNASINTPVDNFGDEYSELFIPAVSGLTTESNYYIQGYRNSFYGTYSSKEGTGMTSESIRSLRSSGKTLQNGDKFVFEVPAGALRVVIAYPADLRDLTEVLDKNDADTNIESAFGNPEIISVSSANNFDSIDYKVYKLDFANPYDTTNVFTVVI